MKVFIAVASAALLLSGCCYRPTPRPCPPAPSYVAPACHPCGAVAPKAKEVSGPVEK